MLSKNDLNDIKNYLEKVQSRCEIPVKTVKTMDSTNRKSNDQSSLISRPNISQNTMHNDKNPNQPYTDNSKRSIHSVDKQAYKKKNSKYSNKSRFDGISQSNIDPTKRHEYDVDYSSNEYTELENYQNEDNENEDSELEVIEEKDEDAAKSPAKKNTDRPKEVNPSRGNGMYRQSVGFSDLVFKDSGIYVNEDLTVVGDVEDDILEPDWTSRDITTARNNRTNDNGSCEGNDEDEDQPGEIIVDILEESQDSGCKHPGTIKTTHAEMDQWNG